MNKILILFFVFFLSFSNSFALTSSQTEKFNKLRELIESYENGSTYISYIDNLVESNKEETSYLNGIKNKISNYSTSNKKVKNVLGYFYVKIVVAFENSGSVVTQITKNGGNPINFSPITKFNPNIIGQDKSQLKTNNPNDYPINGKKIIVSQGQSIQSAINRAGPGDIVMVKSGKYNEVLRISKKGLKGKPIIITNYPGETPIITRENSRNANESTIIIENSKYLVFNGFKIYKPTYYGIWIKKSSEIVISNNEISYLNEQISYTSRGGRSLEVMSRRTEPKCEHILITGNYIHHNHTGHKGSKPGDGGPGNGEALTFLGNVHNSVIENNRVEYNDYIGIDLIGHELGGGYSVFPQPTYNFVRNNHTEKNAVIGAGYSNQIYFDGGLHNVIENNNVINGNNQGISIGQEEAGPSGYHLVRNNLVTGNKNGQLTVGNGDTKKGDVRDILFENNIFRGNKIYNTEGPTSNIRFKGNQGISDR